MGALVVQVGDLVLYRDAEWREIMKERETLRKHFRYVPESKTWVFDIRRFDYTNGNIDEIATYLSSLFRENMDDIKSSLLKAIKEQKAQLEQESRKNIMSLLKEGKFAVRPTKFLDERQREYARMFFVFRDGLYFLDENKLVDYIIEMDMLSEEKVINAIKVVMEECKFRFYKEHLNWLKKNISKIRMRAKKEFELRNTLILRDTGEDIELKINRRLESEELHKLLNTFTTVYFTSDQMGNLTEHRLRVIKYDKVRKTYRIPYFSVNLLLKVAGELGFKKVIDNVAWVKDSIPKPPKYGISLYKFQKEALKNWVKAGARGVVVVPTGGGKTFIGMSALYYMSVPTLICVTTIELARQWRQRLKEYLGIHSGLLGGGIQEIDDVTVAIYNSAVNYIDLIRDRFDLIVFDECHHVPAKTFREVAFKLKARKRLGLSATPKRVDRNEALIFFSVGDVVYQAKYEEMVKLKLAAPLKYYRLYVKLTPDEERKYTAELNGNSSPNKIHKLMKIAFSAKEKYETLKKLVTTLPDDRILVFCQYVDQADKAYKAVREVAKGQVALLTGSTNAKLRRKYFEEFKEGKKRILVTTSVLDEGIDVPDAETAIILSGTGTERQMIQRIGRVIRYRPGKVAKVIEIVAKNTVEERIVDKRSKVLKDYGIKLEKKVKPV